MCHSFTVAPLTAEFTCPVCNRKFKLQRNLQKHLLTHPAQGSGAGRSEISTPSTPVASSSCSRVPDSLIDDVNLETEHDRQELDISDGEEEMFCLKEPVDSYFQEDEDEEEWTRNLLNVIPEGNTKPKTKKKPLIRCHECKGSYQSIQTYMNHRATHAMSDLFFQAPSEEAIKKKCGMIVRSVLQDMASSTLSVSFNANVRDIAKIVLIMIESNEWEQIAGSVVNPISSFFSSPKRYSSPSDLRTDFYKSVAVFHSNRELRNTLVEDLIQFVPTTEKVAHLFFGAFVRKFANDLLAYYVHCMINKGEDIDHSTLFSSRFALTSQPTDTLDFKQLMHYIGGSNIKSILRTAYRIKNPNHEWMRVIKVVKSHFLNSDLADAPEPEVMAWTKCQDRGGLQKIGANAVDFFIELGATVKVLEHLDGSLLLDEVIDKVTNSCKLLHMWDLILKGSLSGEESFKLLHALCTHFCNTWRRGIITRRLDELAGGSQSVGFKHGMAGVPFRATLL